MKKQVLPFLFSFCFFATSAQSPEGKSAGTNPVISAADLLPSSAMQGLSEGPVMESPLNNRFYFNSNAFAFNGGGGAIPVGPFTMKLNDPLTYTSFNNPTSSGEYMLGAAWANGKWYVVRYPDNTLVTIDTIYGGWTDIGPMTPNGTEVWTGMSYDVVAGVMYAISTDGSATSSTLYTIDLGSGTATTVGVAAGVSLINLAANKAGDLYSVDIALDNFGSVDKATGAFTVIGNVGFDASFAQDMEFDHSTDTCFWVCYNVTATAAELRTVDVATGATALVGAFPASSQILGFAIAAGHVMGIPSHGEESPVNLNVYPNPFYEHANVAFFLPQAEKVTLEILDVCGKKATTLLDERFAAGDHTATVNVSEWPSGIYFFRLTTPSGYNANKRVVVQ